MGRVVVIGGGAAGLMAAYAAGSRGAQVTLLERNEKLGKKIYITGKGRCNLTNDCPPDEFLENVVRGGKFLTGVLWSFSPEDMMSLCERFSLPVKVERGNRVFPVSDHASDVTKMLERACLSVGVAIKLQEYVKEIGVLHSTMRDIINTMADIIMQHLENFGVKKSPPGLGQGVFCFSGSGTFRRAPSERCRRRSPSGWQAGRSRG